MEHSQEQTQRLNELRELKWQFEKKLKKHIELKRTFAEKVLDDYQIADFSVLLKDWNQFPDSVEHLYTTLSDLGLLQTLNYTGPSDFFKYNGEKSNLWGLWHVGLSDVVGYSSIGKSSIEQLFGVVKPKDYNDKRAFHPYFPLVLDGIDELDILKNEIEKIGWKFTHVYEKAYETNQLDQ